MQFYGSVRPKFSTDDITGATPAEAKIAFDSTTSYYGRFVADVEHRTVTHVVEAAYHPNLVGLIFKRRFMLDGDVLSLTNTDGSVFEGRVHTAALRWRRSDAAERRLT